MRKFTKIGLLALSLSLVFTMTSCGAKKQEPVAQKDLIILVTDERGLGSGGINDSAWEGCVKAADEFDINKYCISATASDGYAQALKQAVAMEPVLIIAVGEKFETALFDIAAANKAQQFAVIGSGEIGDNVTGITFNDQEAAFLAGIASAMTSKANVVGFIGGVRSAEQDRYEYGFAAGVLTVKKNTYVANNYIGTFIDAAEAKRIAVAQSALGADIIYAPIQDAYAGVLEAASEKGFSTIATQKSTGGETDSVLLLIDRKVDVAVYDIIKTTEDGKFDGKDLVYGLKQGGIEITSENGKLPANVLQETQKYADLIKAGNITVPYDWQTYYTYQASLQ